MEQEIVIHIFMKNPVNVGMSSDVWIYNIAMYLYKKNTLEYVEIVGSEPKSMILNIEGRSIS